MVFATMCQLWLIYQMIKFEEILKFLKIFYDILLRERVC